MSESAPPPNPPPRQAGNTTPNKDNGTQDGSNNNRRRRNNNKNRGRTDKQSKSRSPVRNGRDGSNPKQQEQFKSPQNSKSPTRNRNNNNHHSKSRSPTRSGGGEGKKNNKRRGSPAAMTVISNRCDLWDSAAQFQHENFVPPQTHHPGVYVNPYWFAPDMPPPPNAIVNQQQQQPHNRPDRSVFLARVPYHMEEVQVPVQVSTNHHPDDNQVLESSAEGIVQHHPSCDDVIDNITPNPHDPNVVHGKYWAQRRRLFSRFDRGIQLDPEGWYSVTPEIIADHVARRVATLIANSPAFRRNGSSSDGKGATIVDAFCGCGGNSIAFGKIPSNIVSKVVCIDKDRSKLLKAAHNASLYDIPRDKLIFVECNSIFILKYCYRDGQFILDQPTTTMPEYMPPPVMPTSHAGYQIGGLDLLPRTIDLAFFDPPWGGVDYEVLGKNGYDLEKNMMIQVSPPIVEEWQDQGDCNAGGSDGVSDDFFDTFAQPKQHNMSKNARKVNFNKKTEGEYVNGKDLIALAAAATSARVVLFDLPRNTSRTSLGICALKAGYRGNIKLEEHYLNGRLKTVTAYLGSDYSSLINDSPSFDGSASGEDDGNGGEASVTSSGNA